MQELIKMLREKVDDNLESVRENEKFIRQIIDGAEGEFKDELLKERFDNNKKLLEENNDSINLQMALLKFLSKYEESASVLNYKSNAEQEKKNNKKEYERPKYFLNLDDLTEDESFELTIAGEIKLTPEHPHIKNPDFLDRLIDHYSACEDYEKCQEIVNVKKANV